MQLKINFKQTKTTSAGDVNSSKLPVFFFINLRRNKSEGGGVEELKR